MSCRSCWTHPRLGSPLPIYPRPVSSHIAAAESDEASHPQSIMGVLLVSPRCQLVLHVPHPITPPYRFILPFSFSFPLRVFKMGQTCRRMTTRRWPLTHSRSFYHLASVQSCAFSIHHFLFLLYLIAHPAASLLWGHSLRQQQSWWKALPYLPAHAKSALWDSGNRWRR